MAVLAGAGAGEHETMIRPLCPARPDLVAVDPEAILRALGAGPQGREVGARGGLGEALAPDRVAAQCGQKEPLEQRRPRESDKRGREDLDVLQDIARRVTIARERVDHGGTVQHAPAQAAELLGPAVARPAGVEEHALQIADERDPSFELGRAQLAEARQGIALLIEPGLEGPTHLLESGIGAEHAGPFAFGVRSQ